MINPMYQGPCEIYLDETEVFSKNDCTFYLVNDRLEGFVKFNNWYDDNNKSMAFLNLPTHRIRIANGKSAIFIFYKKETIPDGTFSFRYSDGITGSAEDFFLKP